MGRDEGRSGTALAGLWKAGVCALPGLALCTAIAVFAWVVQEIGIWALAHPYFEALVMAILFGMALRSAWTPGPLWRPGITIGAKLLLEIAVMLLGATVSLGALLASGPALLIGVVLTVLLALATSYGTSRLFGLSKRVAILVACGNSICGNSAIAAVAPVIGAEPDDIASSIAFTAILGVVVVIALPLAFPLLGLSETQYGVLAGLTVYAVPQVLAATVPIGLVSTQVGTLVKLTRVLMLGPVVVALSLGRHRLLGDLQGTGSRVSIDRLVPWFIIGFVALAALRSAGLVPDTLLRPITVVAGLLTIVSMAALGLGVDVRVVGRLSGKVTSAVSVSLVVLLLISLLLIRILRIT